MRIVAIADLQGMCWQIDPEMLPEADMLLIAGDLCGQGSLEELNEVNGWLHTLDYKYIVLIGGNHCIALQEHDGHKIFKDFIYLQDELVEIEGLRIYGSPASDMNELFYTVPWVAFSQPSYLEQVAQNIPENLDILLTHGPCYGILDQLKNGKSVGSKDLRRAVLAKHPKYHVFGHIHESHNQTKLWGVNFINAALCSERNEMFKYDGSLYFDPIVIDL